MRTFTILSSLLTLVSIVKAADYGPCPYKENENCWEIMDNTACFLNPTSTEQIFTCITGGKEGVCACYGCLGYTPVTELIQREDACRFVPSSKKREERLERGS
ncbi:hypothetical protein B0T20DRAFT_430267 [Sordaria brevicollis]|uniref:Uncharacterized protein n=1 Tax=Sordaria brevicollis TaxID=83679 RepID=A0AAE0PJX0_SORBR|nr:hypothetical protein B0T20DRAFT_430267 [Sordaria brevicollis]